MREKNSKKSDTLMKINRNMAKLGSRDQHLLTRDQVFSQKIGKKISKFFVLPNNKPLSK